MNQLLIHSENTILADNLTFSKEEQFVFSPDFDIADVDYYITAILENGDLKNKLMQATILFIKVALSNNYLEYLGIRLAYHIRLTKGLKNSRFIPIVFVADESYQFLGLTTELSEILFTSGIYLIQDNKEDYDKCLNLFYDGRVRPLKSGAEFIKKVRVHPPANYQTHHSIANEWCILRWAEMANNITEQERVELKSHIKTTQTLYYKYLEERAVMLSEKENRQPFKIEDNRKTLVIPKDETFLPKIYYIDDEVDKGWGSLFKDIIFKKYTDVGAYSYFNEFKKGEKQIELLERLKDKVRILIKDEGYNVFIIDLRLCDSDFQGKEELSGISLIREIKKLNKGVQIVIFTASKKADNAKKAFELGVSSYIQKESPENVLSRLESYQVFVEFSHKFLDAVKKSFLADLYVKIQDIKQLGLVSLEIKLTETKFRADAFQNGGIFDKIYNLIDKGDSLFTNDALLNSFSFLEKFCDQHFISEKGSGKIDIKGKPLLQVYVQTEQQREDQFEFIRGNFPFQNNSKSTITDVVFKHRSLINSHLESENLGLTKIITVLKFRYEVSAANLKKIIELRYLRSNLAAHNTGNVDETKRVITFKDLLILLDVFKEILV